PRHAHHGDGAGRKARCLLAADERSASIVALVQAERHGERALQRLRRSTQMQHAAMGFGADLAQSMLAGEAAQTVEVRRLGATMPAEFTALPARRPRPGCGVGGIAPATT